MRTFLSSFIQAWDSWVLWYFAGVNLVYGVLFLASIFETWKNFALVRRLHLRRRLGEEFFPPISVVLPAFDEEPTILDSVRAQLALDYPRHEVIVVNDGSTDGTLEVLREAFDLYEVPPAYPRKLRTETVRAVYRARGQSRLVVIDKENGGKADAINAGIDLARYPLLATVDADTIVDRNALPRIVRPFLLSGNTVASGGTIRISNNCTFERGELREPHIPAKMLPGIQVPEYLRAFLFGRMGWNRLGGNLLISGAFALYRRDVLLSVGGFDPRSVTEDFGLTVALHRKLRQEDESYELPFVPDPVAWTEAPERYRDLAAQRERWHRGLIRTLLDNVGMLFNPKYGTVGMFVFPFFLLGDMLSPAVEILGYFIIVVGGLLGLIGWTYALWFFALALGYMMMLSVWALCLEELTYRVYRSPRDFWRMVGFAVLEPFGYHQLTVWWRLKAYWRALIGSEDWGHHERKGVREAGPEERRSAA